MQRQDASVFSVTFKFHAIHDLCADKLLLGIRALWLLLQSVLAVEGVQGAVSSLLARHEHSSEGGSHTGGSVKLGHLQAK